MVHMSFSDSKKISKIIYLHEEIDHLENEIHFYKHTDCGLLGWLFSKLEILILKKKLKRLNEELEQLTQRRP